MGRSGYDTTDLGGLAKPKRKPTPAAACSPKAGGGCHKSMGAVSAERARMLRMEMQQQQSQQQSQAGGGNGAGFAATLTSASASSENRGGSGDGAASQR
ncbi:hypothetical protein CORC01_01143 [Colletotrichum orchidophilum]|uniref:Uncharacterized protein n=1 Tax=Colletotrichum orchidophilum TaxID=1209926 RepID=A0A1G4BPS9_9PEZI|nr:uncharacterized protein CORC01_01143 [Colletotrichum orchidophilum]OHF03424.1 hypothetical protein CORC01_01143 [Colletotrichum orchidophilum]